MNLTVSEETVVELSAYLSGRKKIYEAICKKFEEKYNSLNLLEKRIEEDGVPLDNHSLWDDAIEWRNAVAELNQIKYFETKIRAYYTENLFLDVFYNEETGRYDFALIYNNDRVLGWDNAPHHRRYQHIHITNMNLECFVTRILKEI